MMSAELIQFGQQIAHLHRWRFEDAPGSGSSPPLRRGQASVERLPDDGGHRCTALAGESADPLVALIVDENLQPVCQHEHTLACVYARGRAARVARNRPQFCNVCASRAASARVCTASQAVAGLEATRVIWLIWGWISAPR